MPATIFQKILSFPPPNLYKPPCVYTAKISRIMKKFYFILLGLACFTFNKANAQTTVSALITSSQVWDISGSPYNINQNTYVDTGVTIIVKPGVEIISSGNYRIDINGEFQAIGKWDSIIKITKLEFNFTNKSKDYNASTGRGTYFKYCQFNGSGSGYKTIGATNTSLKIEHCQFYNSYFSLYMTGSFPYDSTITDVSYSTFYGDTYGNGTPISGNNMGARLKVTNCSFNNSSNIYTYGNVTYKNNTFRKLRRVNAEYMWGHNEFTCNRFINMIEGVDLNLSGLYTKGTLDFSYNTLDSIGANMTAFYGMLKITKPASNYAPWGKVDIHNNNFLTRNYSWPKVMITGSNQTPTKTDTVNCTGNYWGSSDSTTIAGYIKDYNDDIYIYGRVDFSSYLNAPVTGCSYNTGCNQANFTYSITDSLVTFKDSSYGSNPYTVKWVFGDGTMDTTNSDSVVHGYPSVGNYNACMYIYDTTGNLCDSMCSLIVIRSSGRCHADFYIATDTSDDNTIYIVNTSTGTDSKTKYYWTFGDATGSSSANPSHTYSSIGKYQVCLTLFDTSVGCYSTYCDSLEITTSGMELLILNEKDILSVNTPGIFNSAKLYPNPNSGRLNISFNNLSGQSIQLSIMTAAGQVVRTEQ